MVGDLIGLCTGAKADDVQSALKAIRLGAHDFLTKPPSGPAEVILTVSPVPLAATARRDQHGSTRPAPFGQPPHLRFVAFR